MIRVALDAMGGDNAPVEIIAGGILAVNELSDLYLCLVGPQAILEKHLADMRYPKDRVELIYASEVVENDEAPVMAVRKKSDSSMMRAITLVKDGKVDVAVSAGNTGALMAGSLLITGRLEGIERPALTIVAPTFNNGNVVLLDVGANMDAKAEHLLHYGLMGKIYCREVLDKPLPRVGLLNVGLEELKGNEQVKKAYKLFKDKMPNFFGNVEARDILNGAVDVVVSDGFVGNILLKTVEGISAGLFTAMKEAFSSDLKSKLGAALLMPALKNFKKRLDYAEYGGAPFLGIGGACIKCHGSSKARAVRSAIVTQAYRYARQDVNGHIKKEMALLKENE